MGTTPSSPGAAAAAADDEVEIQSESEEEDEAIGKCIFPGCFHVF